MSHEMTTYLVFIKKRVLGHSTGVYLGVTGYLYGFNTYITRYMISLAKV